jgi:hypothetical protein
MKEPCQGRHNGGEHQGTINIHRDGPPCRRRSLTILPYPGLAARRPGLSVKVPAGPNIYLAQVRAVPGGQRPAPLGPQEGQISLNKFAADSCFGVIHWPALGASPHYCRHPFPWLASFAHGYHRDGSTGLLLYPTPIFRWLTALTPGHKTRRPSRPFQNQSRKMLMDPIDPCIDPSLPEISGMFH